MSFIKFLTSNISFKIKDDLGKNFLYSLVKIPVPQPISKIELISLFNISAFSI